MRIWSIILAGAGASIGLASPLLAEPSPAGAPVAMMGKSFSGSRPIHGGIGSGTVVHRWGPRFQGRWFVGWRAPGGWAAYRRPVVGYVLPPYWISPSYRIGNYGAYGLPAPADGYGWSRYYDDAVMIDGDGRVKERRDGVDWDRSDALPPPGVGYDDDVTTPEAPKQLHEDRFEGEDHRSYGADYDAPHYAAVPIVRHQDGPGQRVVTTTHAPGYFADGYYYPGATTTTVVVQPQVTTTTSYVTEVRRHAVRRKVRHSCNCK